MLNKNKLIEYRVGDEPIKMWFWYRGGRTPARDRAIRHKGNLIKNINFKRAKSDRVEPDDVRLFLNGVRIKGDRKIAT